MWDGDYCCVAKMKIMQEGYNKNGGFFQPMWMNEQLEKSMKANAGCDEFEEDYDTTNLQEYHKYLELKALARELS